MKRLFGRWNPELLVLIIGALATRLIDIGYPASTVFDEVYFKQFVSSYFTHRYYFDIHPPLGKLIIAGWAWLWQLNPLTLTLPPATGLRVLVALFGASLVPLTYGVLRRLSGSRVAATLAAVAVMLDGALIVESRFVLVDSLLLAFGLGAVYAALRWQERPGWGWLATTGLLAGAAASIKWTGLTALALALLILAKGLIEQHGSWWPRLGRLAGALALAAVVYIGSFAIHFALLSHSGPGDAFMPPTFQATLVGNPSYLPSARLSFWAKFIDLNKEMYNANATLTATHPYGSKWYTWPIEQRPIYFWEGQVDGAGRQSNIYLFGDPLIWWLGTLSVIAAAAILTYRPWRERYHRTVPVLGFLVFAYLLNWLPFAGIKRVMFLYHYLFAVIFSFMILGLLIAEVLPIARHWSAKTHRRTIIAFIILAVAGFLFWAPLTYGWPLSHNAEALHTWLPSWR